jgi:hypothetical protein
MTPGPKNPGRKLFNPSLRSGLPRSLRSLKGLSEPRTDF